MTIFMKPEDAALEPVESPFNGAERAALAMGPATAAAEDSFSHHNVRVEVDNGEARMGQGGEMEKPAVAPSLFSRSPILAMAASAAIGAIVSAVAVIVLSPKLVPTMDARLLPVADRVAALELRQQQAEAAVGRLNNEIAQALEADGAAAFSIEQQGAALAEMQGLVSGQIAETPVTGADAALTTFAVAVGQLRSAFYSGRPFEAEIVTLRALADGDETLLNHLNELSGPARPGVASAALLREKFAGYAATAGLTLSASQSYYDYGVSLVGEYVGYNAQPYSVQLANVMVDDADRRLAEGDVAGAIEVIDGLDSQAGAAFEPWLKDAAAYVRVEASIASMTETVVDRLRERLGSKDAG